MEYETFENHDDATQYLRYITQQQYCVSTSSSRIWGDNMKDDLENFEELRQEYALGGSSIAPSELYNIEKGMFYQIVPDTEDDGFFDWYCQEREGYQNFKTVEMAVIYFVKYWTKWQRHCSK